MSNILIGSSNVARFYRADLFTKYRPYTLVRSTEISSFRSAMEDATSAEKNFVISVIENFVSGKVQSKPDAVVPMIKEATEEFFTIVQSAAIRLPESNFAIVMPLQRPSLQWYQDNIQEVKACMEEGINRLKLDNVSKVECISSITQQFIPDGVHLSDASGKGFLDFILGQSEAFFNSSRVDLTADDDLAPPPPKKSSKSSIETRLSQLESDSKNRQKSDNMMFARLREELDTVSNKAKEDRVVLSGLVCKKPIPSEIKARTQFLSEVAMEIFNFLCPDFTGKITFISQGRTGDHMLPMAEVRLDSVVAANLVRKSFAAKNKAKLLTGDRERLFVTNSVNLATRVRIEILKAIAKNVGTSDVLAYVVSFIPRPVLHVRRKSVSTNQRSYTFVDAVGMYGHLLALSDLTSAYKKAGKSFDGQLQQNFIVLNEEDQQKCWGSLPAAPPSGYRGRGRGHWRGSGNPSGGRHGAGGTKRRSSPDAGTSRDSGKFQKYS
jgi:hypothetical protein